jgi:alanine-glyoxylate transaminase/serine-glyoxylate transaminase/serine-pyruvate transaminase
VAAAARRLRPAVIAVVHAETSTGALTDIGPIAAIARETGALLLVDAVTSLGGIPLEVDAWGIDACYSGTQKCLSCPPGLAPVTLGGRTLARVAARRTKVPSWYLDVTLLTRYWEGAERVYHHTAPISMIYALREALRIVHEEGLEARFARHRENHAALVAGLEAMGLALVVPAPERLPQLNAVAIPDGVDDAKVRRRLLEFHGIEIGPGLGVFKGKVWRVGLMGHGSTRSSVLTFLSALEQVLSAEGRPGTPGAGVAAAAALYAALP